MCTSIMADVWRYDVPPEQKLLLLKIADIANHEGLATFSADQISKCCGMRVLDVYDCLTMLLKSGHLSGDISDDELSDVLYFSKEKNVCNIKDIINIRCYSTGCGAMILHSDGIFLTKIKTLATD